MNYDRMNNEQFPKKVSMKKKKKEQLVRRQIGSFYIKKFA